MKLGEYIQSAVPSGRLILEDSTGEIYRGFAGTLKYAGIEESREIISHGLQTDIYRKEKGKIDAREPTKPPEKVDRKSIGKYSFSDLELRIYDRVVLEG